MAKKTVEINGVRFNLNENKKRPILAPHYYDLYACYDRPSEAKKSIFAWWKRWYNEVVEMSEKSFKSTSFHSFGIQTFNCMMFTLQIQFEYDGVFYDALIYPTHNELYYHI